MRFAPLLSDKVIHRIRKNSPDPSSSVGSTTCHYPLLLGTFHAPFRPRPPPFWRILDPPRQSQWELNARMIQICLRWFNSKRSMLLRSKRVSSCMILCTFLHSKNVTVESNTSVSDHSLKVLDPAFYTHICSWFNILMANLTLSWQKCWINI